MSELIIRRAENKLTNQLTELWLAAFPSDPPDYIDGFFAHLPQDAVTLVGERDGIIVTMLFLLPAEAIFHGKHYPVRYLYAGCTHPLHRGHGYYRELMTAAERSVAVMGENAIYLHPADDRLIDTYKRLGYRPGIFRSCAKKDQQMTACMTVDEYIQKRSARIDHVSQDTVFWGVNDASARFFVADASARGANMAYNQTGVALLFDDTAIESVDTDARRENADYCLWLPIGDAPLTTFMNEFDGVTGVVGDG